MLNLPNPVDIRQRPFLNSTQLNAFDASEVAKASAQKKTEGALQTLQANQQDCEKKLADLHRRMEEATDEVKALLQKGQKEKAKLVLRRKKMLEKQATAVQNVRDPSAYLIDLPCATSY
jgi:predicted  nucleic acid-binding Zn-ribbon protein